MRETRYQPLVCLLNITLLQRPLQASIYYYQQTMAMRGLLLPTVAAVLLLLTVTQASNDLTIPQQQRQAATTECTLNCPNDAPCRFGQADFSGHIVEVVGQQQQQATDTSQNGGMMHCDCPMGMYENRMLRTINQNQTTIGRCFSIPFTH